MDGPNARFDIETGTLTIEGITLEQADAITEGVMAYGRALARSKPPPMPESVWVDSYGQVWECYRDGRRLPIDPFRGGYFRDQGAP